MCIARRVGLVCALGLLVACGRHSVSEIKDDAAPQQSLAVELFNAKKLASKNETLTPEEAFLKLDSKGQKAFLTSFLESFFTMFNAEGVISVLRAIGKNDETAKELIKNLRLHPTDEQAVQKLLKDTVDYLLIYFKENGSSQLNNFPTIPMEAMRSIQTVALNAGMNSGRANLKSKASEALPYDLELPANWSKLQFLRNDGCEREKRQLQVVGSDLSGLFSGMEPINDKDTTVDCFARNSDNFAVVLNQLANTEFGKEVSLTLPDKTEIKNYTSLLKYLNAQGFTLEFYTSRVLVDFFGLWFQDKGNLKSLRVATHIEASVSDDMRIKVPAEHGEANAIVHKDGKRYAQVRWYFGVPVSGMPSTFWRGQLHLQSPWTAPLNERVEVFAPSKAAEYSPRALEWLKVTASVMTGFQHVQNVYAAPLNSYGLFICADSLIIAANLLNPNEKMTKVFPIVRPGELDYGKSDTLKTNVEEVFAAAAPKLDLKSLNKHYPSDYKLDPKLFKQRLLEAFPNDKKQDARLASFPEFKASLEKLRK